MVHETVKRVKLEMFDHWSQTDFRVSHRLELFIEEFRHLHRISLANDRIANFLGLYADSHQLLIFTEYLPNGSVKDKIMNNSIDEDTAVHYFFEALRALDYLHTLDPPIIHRDIKAANLLLTISNSIKLANFGLVRDLAVDGFGLAVASDISLDFRGTLLYVAPEVLTSELGPGNRNAYGKPADVWALGCTFIEMLTRYPPHFEYFGHVEGIQKEILDRASGDKSNWLPYDSEVLVPTSSQTVHNLIDFVFERNPNKRPTTTALCKMLNTLAKAKTTKCNFQALKKNESPSSSTIIEPRIEDVVKADKETVASTYIPLETLENGVVRRKRQIKRVRRKRGLLEKMSLTSLFFFSRVLYFSGILGRSVLYIISFLLLGLGTLALFLFIAYCIVLFFRYLIKLNCNCDLWQPQYIIISGILLILLFALMFSCCMVALGEYKFRKANKALRESQFFVRRPHHDLVFCGITILRARQNDEEEEDELHEPPDAAPVQPLDNEKFYYQ
ncbi:unnamed protein product [Cylicocyclus nassatus]|uniref:Protein kinase domain-containing protein n=1 Tax=Cylicocyclus nassatus TaxID=53992 RepID=A0AA36HFF8_CYLNA|nr:unnamed protein product [Cylicocyclus nassatus]